MGSRTNWPLKLRILEQFGQQEEFAFAVGTSGSWVSRVIHGYRRLGDEEKKLWARLLKSKVSDLFPKEEG